MTDKPICYDLFCGLGGWSEGFLAEGYECIGFDIEAHRYPKVISTQSDAVKRPGMNWSDRSLKGSKDAQFNRTPDLDPEGGWMEYPGKLILRDIRSIHGSELKDAAVIVASPPCQKYSYMAMPWKRAKAQAAAIREDLTGKKLQELNELFNECFRIQREAIEAAGHHIPLIVENVRGAQKWVGRARWNYGSFYLWGDVPALMPLTLRAPVKTVGHINKRDGHSHTRHLTNPRESEILRRIDESGVKGGGDWFGSGADCSLQRHFSGVKQSGISGTRENGKGDRWFQDGAAQHGSKSNARKAASALIAKIPYPLAQHIARTYKPKTEAIA